MTATSEPTAQALSKAFMDTARALPTIFDLSTDARELLIRLEEAETPEELEAMRAALLQNDAELLAKIDGYVVVISEFEHLAGRRKAERDRLDQRAKTAQAHADWLRSRLLSAMQALGEKRIETGRHTVSVKLNPPSAVIVDEEAVPQEFKELRTTLHIDKNRIKAHVKETGEVVPGVVIERSESLSLR